MSNTIAGELRQAFELSSMRREAAQLQTPWQMARATEILEQAHHARETEHASFNDQYATRLEAAQRKLIDDAGRKNRDFVPQWAAHDRFDQHRTGLQAQRNVRADYERRIMAINQQEHRALLELLQKSDRENAMRGKARDAFSQAADRRLGTDRRHVGPQQ